MKTLLHRSLLKVFPVILMLNLFCSNKISAQAITGTKNIPTDYATVAAAITALNTNGVGTGGVVFNISAPYSETFGSATAGQMTFVGGNAPTAANQVIFQASGSGAVTITSASGLAGSTDYIIQLYGISYVTFNKINLTAADNTIEYGLWLSGQSAAGCAYNTYENGTITLNNTNSNSACVYTSSTATSSTYANSNNAFYNNTMQNAVYGYEFIGSTTTNASDQNNFVGAIAGGASTITKLGNSFNGVLYKYQQNLTISNTLINNNATSTTGTAYGIYTNAGTGNTANIYGNTIGGAAASPNPIVTAGTVNGIEISNGTANTYNNTITGITCPTLVGILYNSTSTASSGNILINNIYGNSMSGFGTLTGFTGIQQFAAAAASYTTFNIYNNTIGGNSSSPITTSSGVLYGVFNSNSANVPSCTVNIFGNNISYLTSTSSGSPNGILSPLSSLTNIYGNTISSISSTSGSVTGISVGPTTTTNTSPGLNVYNNYISGLSTSGAGAATVIGVNFYSVATSTNTDNIYGNTIYNVNATATGITGNVTGLQINGLMGYSNSSGLVNVFNNLIYHIINPATSSTAGLASGIFLGSTTLSGTRYPAAISPTNVYNNMIYDIEAVNSAYTTVGGGAIGILVSGLASASNAFKIYYNTIYMYGAATSSSQVSSALAILGQTAAGSGATGSPAGAAGGIAVENNILVNTISASSKAFAFWWDANGGTSPQAISTATTNNLLYAPIGTTYYLYASGSSATGTSTNGGLSAALVAYRGASGITSSGDKTTSSTIGYNGGTATTPTASAGTWATTSFFKQNETTTGTVDVHLASSAVDAINLGTITLSSPYTTDFDYDARPNTASGNTKTSIGADEPAVTCATAAPTGPTSQSFCSGINPTTANLSITGSSIKWYNAPVNGTVVTGNALTTATTYYASQTTTCESPTRLVVNVTIFPTPTVTTTAPANTCPITTADLTVGPVTTGSTLGLTYSYWTNAGATSSYATPAAAAAGTYYVKGVTAAGCSAVTAVTPTINSCAPPACPYIGGTITTPYVIICSGTTTNLAVSGSTGTNYNWQISTDNINWSDISGATTTSYTTTSGDGTSNKFYRMLSKSTACWNVASTTAEVDISNPTITLTAGNITDNSVTLNWSPTGTGNYAISYSGTSSATQTSVTPAKTITGLTAGGTYSITVTQTGVAGCSASGTLTGVNTLCAMPTGVTLSSPANAQILVSWTGVGGANYRVYYRPLFAYGYFFTKDVSGVSSALITKQGNNNLYGNTTYEVYVSRLDCPSAGLTGQPTNPTNVTTLPTLSCSTPVIDSVRSLCPVQIEVFIHPGSSPTNTYNVYLQRLTPTILAVNSYGVAGNYFTINTPYSGDDYLIAIDSKCSGGALSALYVWPGNVAVKPICTSPANLVLSNPTCHGFTASWNGDQCLSNPASGYNFYMRQVGTINYNSYGVAVPSGGIGPNKPINWLTSGRNYQVFIRSVYSCNGFVTYGPSSQTQTIATLSSGCRDEEDVQPQETKQAVQQYSPDNQEVFSLYPNPSSGQFAVDLGRMSNEEDGVRIEVINMLGQTVMTHLTTISGGHMSEFINLPNGTAAGTYIVRLTAGKNVYTTKINVSK